MMNYSAITIRGNILSYEQLEKIQNAEAVYQSASNFGFAKGTNLRDKIGTAWSESKLLWNIYQSKIQALPETETGTSETRKLWMIPFLMELAYDPDTSKAVEIDGKSYAISHHDSKRDQFPILIMGHFDKLDSKPDGSRLRMSPHALMQEYLNKTEHLYGLVTNGRSIRLIRDSYRLARLSFIEFDLERIYEEELYFEFALLYRLLHSTRMPGKLEQAEKAPIEIYHQDSLDAGARIRDQLRHKVKEAMEVLAKGLIQDHQNHEFALAIRDEKISPQAFYKLLLRVMYRIIFLSTIEERDLVFPKKDKKAPDLPDHLRKKDIYARFYSIERLRRLAASRVYINPDRHDLWQSLTTTFKLFEPTGEGEKLGILPLGGDLFAEKGLATDLNGYNLAELACTNRQLITIIENLTTFHDTTGAKVRVNYRDLDVEELGSIYEALLELHPYFNKETERLLFGFSEGSQRKLTGSYYTRHDLVAQLIKTALFPVLEDRLATAKTKDEKEQALLSIKVCDPAAGSGHFLIAAARTLGFELAKIRSGEENPGENWVMDATRDVISHCIHGIDKNPDAVELCRISLWLTGHSSGKPLTFIDHKIKCGDSLVGVDKLDRLREGIPDGAFNAVTGDDKKTASFFKKRNAIFVKKRQGSLFTQGQMQEHQHRFAERYQELNRMKMESAKDYTRARQAYQSTFRDPLWQKDHTEANLFTWSFFQPYKENAQEKEVITSDLLYQFHHSAGSVNAPMEAIANSCALEYGFFHWPLEFPDVFEKGGFDLLLANPPWERIKLQEKEFFIEHDKRIAEAPNAAARKLLIDRLKEDNPELLAKFHQALHESEASAKFIRESARYPLTGGGDINTYSIFSELIKQFLNQQGQAGFIVPSGIATDDTNKHYFASLVEKGQLVSLFDFENKKAIFPSVHRSFKFSLLTLGKPEANRKSMFGFFLHDVLDLLDHRRVFELTKEDFLNINPNTKTTPIFRTRQDAELTAKIYSWVPVLVNESKKQNPWGTAFGTMFHMSNDSGLFKTFLELTNKGFVLCGNRFRLGNEIWLPLYEAKLIWQYDHRFSTFFAAKDRFDFRGYDNHSSAFSKDMVPWYWVSQQKVLENIGTNTWPNYLGFRKTSNTTNERTSIFSFFPLSAVNDKQQLVETASENRSLLLANFNSIILDYSARQKVGGTDISFHYLKQFPILSPEILKAHRELWISKTLELTYTSWDIKGFADDLWKEADEPLRQAIQAQWEENKSVTGGHEWHIPDWAEAYPEIEWEQDKGCPLPPFKWDEDRRAQLRAELDAYFALLYGLERDELRYILDPQDVYGEDFPGETFRVLKEKEIKKYGEYRTRRLVLTAYDRLRPTWDMDAHLAHLKEVWEKYQEDLSGKKVDQMPKVSPEPKVKSVQHGTLQLFDQPNIPVMKEFGLHEGIYSISDAARIIGFSPDKVRRWFKELASEKYEGVSGFDAKDIEKSRISFHGLIELVVIGVLREYCSLKTILVARKDLGSRTSKSYPFANNNVDKQLRIAGSGLCFILTNGDIINLDSTGQYNLEIIKLFFKDVVFNKDGIAHRLMPTKGKGRIVIDPKLAGGQPSILDTGGISVDIIKRFYRGPESLSQIVKMHGVTKEDIDAVLSYTS
ncbi:MAG: DUF433 domain-containing protein [Imperialibacter sp.]|uniref:Eco57I restriction-modification methylase domain-containing protein n=1 Tax=Imperialibacter sp. TaxID=2038411 RepID=UPI0032EC269B